MHKYVFGKFDFSIFWLAISVLDIAWIPMESLSTCFIIVLLDTPSDIRLAQNAVSFLSQQ